MDDREKREALEAWLWGELDELPDELCEAKKDSPDPIEEAISLVMSGDGESTASVQAKAM